jgi:signal transduction histidine kinase
MTEGEPIEERLRKLRHDLANPLSAILAEAQLLLLRDPPLDKDTLEAIRSIEEQSRRMRDMLHQS